MNNVKDIRHRAVFLSDVHLGTRNCQAEMLQQFLRSIDCQYLYLVGDIVDVRAMRRGFLYWPQQHNNLLRTILGMARRGTRVTYVPGNHDELFRQHVRNAFGNISIERTTVHETASGQRLLVIHGDEFDSLLQCPRLENIVGTVGYELIMSLNQLSNYWRALTGQPYWSLAAAVKSRIGNARRHIDDYERVVSRYAAKRGFDGVVCGHIHKPAARSIGNVAYYNCGDWVEHCSAMVESADGTLTLVDWAQQSQLDHLQRAA